MSDTEGLIEVLSDWFGEWQSLNGVHSTNSGFFEPIENEDGGKTYCNTYLCGSIRTWCEGSSENL